MKKIKPKKIESYISSLSKENLNPDLPLEEFPPTEILPFLYIGKKKKNHKQKKKTKGIKIKDNN